MRLTVLTLMLGSLALILLVLGIVAVMLWRSFQGQARRLGYRSMGEYLAAAPRSDEEKREAVNLTLKGVVLCLLGFFFPPFLLVGLFPLFYGGRKLAWASMGLGLVDDAE